MSKFGDFEKAVVAGAKGLAATSLKGFITEAQDDAEGFLAQHTADLRQWTSQLDAGELTKDEFADLMKGDADLAELDALTRAGVAAADLQRFRDALINLVIDAATKAFLPTV
jgi:hypothetical protein